MAATNRQPQLWGRVPLFILVALILSSAGKARGQEDINPNTYSQVRGERFYLLTDATFSSEEEAVVRCEIGDNYFPENYGGIDIVVYRVPNPVEFLKQQKNLHRPKVDGQYRGEGLANALEYIWDVCYKKSRLAWQKIFSYTARKKVTEQAPETRQAVYSSYTTQFENNPQFQRLQGFDFIERFRYPLLEAAPIGPPAGVALSGSSSNFIKPRTGNVYIPLGRRAPGLYLVEAMAGQFRACTLVFVSDTVAITKISREQLVVWSVQKNTGEPSPQTRLLVTDGVGQLESGASDDEGICVFKKKNPERSYVIGQDSRGGVFISENFYYDSEIYDATLYGFTDRPLYRPGDTVFVKIMGRVFESALASKALPTASVRMVVLDSNGTAIIVKNLEVNSATSGGDTSFTLPEFAAVGGYSLQFTYKDKTYTAAFRVANYIKPHYEIAFVLDRQAYKTGEQITGRLKLSYPDGKPVAGASVELVLRTQKCSMAEGELRYLDRFPIQVSQQSLKAADNGTVAISLPAAKEPSRYIIDVRTSDKASYRVTAVKELMIEAGSQILALKTERIFTPPGEPVLFQLRVAEPGPVDNGSRPAAWEAVRLEDQQRLTGSIAAGAESFTIAFEKSGSYVVTVKDDKGFILASASHWVQGPELKTTPGSISIVFDRERYSPGQTARALITFSEKVDHGLATLERDSVEQYCPVERCRGWVALTRLSDCQWQAEIPIRDTYAPNMTFSIVYVLGGRYLFQNAGITVEVPAVDITLTPDKAQYQPGDTVTIDIETRLAGKPVQAGLSLGVVDEMIYVLQPEIAPEITEFFYHRRRNQVRTFSSLSFYTYDAAVSAGGKSPNAEGYSERPLKLRERPRREDKDTAYWGPDLSTDATGRLRITFTMPDSLTRWRITGRAMTAGGIVGQRKNFIVSSKDCYLKWTGPSAFRAGDEPVVHLAAFNMKDQPLQAEFTAEGQGVALRQPVTLQPGTSDIALKFKAEQDGVVKTALLVDGLCQDSLETHVAALPPRWLTTKVQPLELQDGAAPVVLPPNSFNVRLSITGTASDLFLQVADRLIDYPYGCVEQTASRLIPVSLAYAAMKQSAGAETVSRRLEQLIVNNRLRLISMAGPKAVFGWWGNMTRESAFMTAYAYYADWLASRSLGISQAASHWANMLEVYKKDAASQDLLSNAVCVFLAREMKLPCQTLVEGLQEQAAATAIAADTAAVDCLDASCVLGKGDANLRTGFAIALIEHLAAGMKLKPSERFSANAQKGFAILGKSSTPFARSLVLLKKSRQGLTPDDRQEAQKVLAAASLESPTIDRALVLIFVSAALDLKLQQPLPAEAELGPAWRKEKSSTGVSLWRYTGAGLEPQEQKLKLLPQQTARLIYESYGPEEHRLPLTIERKLYRLSPAEKDLAFTAAAMSSWELSPAELYVDEIRLAPEKDTVFDYGLVEVPLPPGADVEATTWGMQIAGLNAEQDFKPMAEARHTRGSLSYAIAVEHLQEPVVFHHLVRFSQTGAFCLPQPRYFRMYMPGEKAFGQGNKPEFQTAVVH